MELLGSNNSWLRLEIAGYQFPDSPDAEYDSNWLVIEGHIGVDGRDWRFRDPCLMTYEVARLAAWLCAVAAGTEAEDGVGFTEPNLEFRRVSSKLLRVFFALESRPPWAAADASWEDHYVDVPIDRAMLERAAADLRAGLARFPQRTER